MPRLPPPRAAYVHVPFCSHRCAYCNFTVVQGRSDLEADFLLAIERELRALQHPQPVDTLFIGGGTPTELSFEHLRRLCALLDEWFPRAVGHETSIEANPDSLDEPNSDLLRHYGVTRLSLGVQSFNAQKLQTLDRRHSLEDIARSAEVARRKFPQFSVDLIFAAEGETIEEWQDDLASAIQWNPDHVSTYGLTIEQGTLFWNRRRHGELLEVDDERQCHMYLAAIDRLSEAGFEHYEISNFARPGSRCRHNQIYWSGESYFAVGPGASRYVDGVRETNHRSTTTYLRRVLAGQSPVAESEVIDAEERAREKLVFGLRQRVGVAIEHFASETGFTVDELAGREVAANIDRGLLELHAGHLRLTRNGLLLCDSIVGRILVAGR